MGLGIAGEYTGFTFGNTHSSELGITRVSNGSRYEAQLGGNFKDYTAEVPGAMGTYYFGSDYGTKDFNINIAYDNVTMDQIHQMKKLFTKDKMAEFRFDEMGDKRYTVKVKSPIRLTYLPMEDQIISTTKYVSDYDRSTLPLGEVNKFTANYSDTIFKGEGTIELVAYFPYAWVPKEISVPKNTKININYNGDLATDFQLNIAHLSNDFTILFYSNDTERLIYDGSVDGTGSQYLFDSSTQLVLKQNTIIVSDVTAHTNWIKIDDSITAIEIDSDEVSNCILRYKELYY